MCGARQVARQNCCDAGISSGRLAFGQQDERVSSACHLYVAGRDDFGQNVQLTLGGEPFLRTVELHSHPVGPTSPAKLGLGKAIQRGLIEQRGLKAGDHTQHATRKAIIVPQLHASHPWSAADGQRVSSLDRVPDFGRQMRRA